MRKINYIKSGVFILTLSTAISAANAGDKSLFDSVDSGLATVENTAQSGRQATDANATAANTISTDDISLTDILANQLGVSQQQASGGAGALFQTAKTNKAPQAFTTLSQSVPGLSDMLSAAPQTSNSISSLSNGISSIFRLLLITLEKQAAKCQLTYYSLP
mgnify:CR=1 FL=1|tara:strand:+ start:483 stop:968 length:486 start_codon:yes stop_codon:yes gene_type:complete